MSPMRKRAGDSGVFGCHGMMGVLCLGGAGSSEQNTRVGNIL